MVLFDLFFTFLKIGAFAFGGGYAVLPFIEQYVVNDKAWLTIQELTDLVSLSQMTPGPIAINSATFIGTKVAGIPGALAATAGNVLPQLTLMMILGYFLFGGRKLKFLDAILVGLKPAIVGLIAIAALSMFTSSLFIGKAWDFSAISLLGAAGFVLGFFFYRKKKLSVIQIVVLAAAVGLVWHGIQMIV